MVNRKPDASVLSSYAYGYDYDYGTSSYSLKGYRTSMTDHLAQQEKYYLDSLYQLTRTDYGNGDVHQWAYDDIGNRVQQTVTPSGQPPQVTTYTYYQNPQGKNSQILQSDGASTYAWDNNGNLLTKGAFSYAWDYDDRLVGINGPSLSASYVYDYEGKRIKRTIAGVPTVSLYQAEDILKETSGGTVASYLHGTGIDDPVLLDRGGAKSYYYSDGLGSIREMADSGGTAQNSYAYGAWGEMRAQSVTIPNIYGYTGREFAEEGLYYYRARYMDPRVGRFVSRDQIYLKTELNRYYYVANSPIDWVDSDGLTRRPVDGPIRNDTMGCGHFEATRYDEKTKTRYLHGGVDLEGYVGEDVRAPITGRGYRDTDQSIMICTTEGYSCCEKKQLIPRLVCWRLVHIRPRTDMSSDTNKRCVIMESEIVGTIDTQSNNKIFPHVHIEYYVIECGRTYKRDPTKYLF